jgi:peptidoglycan/LPS O-acetylase OafA/YrhL
MNKLEYPINNNIQILRGLAVLSVLLFHLDFALFSLGFLGVDVFFIISGYLMPIIIPKYTPLGFIKARVVRLYPVLAIMTIFTLLVCYLVQMPGEYLTTAKSSIASSFFLSFIFFQNNTGYFDIASGMQPLLHTWSLGAEFCAYILLFLILFIAPKKKHILPISLFMLIVSLLYVVISAFKEPLNYYDPIPRFFLFFAGVFFSQLMLEQGNKLKKSSLISISLIFSIAFISILFFVGENSTWPNISTILLPGMFIPFILMNNPNRSLGTISNSLKKIGDWSYSIYIWHWPIIVLLKLVTRQVTVHIWQVALLLFVTSIAVGIASFYLIEKNKIFRGKVSILSFVLILLISSSIIQTKGFSDRIDPSLVKYYYLDDMISQKHCQEQYNLSELNFCGMNLQSKEKGVLIIGDSHAKHFLPTLKAGFDGAIYHLDVQPDLFVEKWVSVRLFMLEHNISKLFIAYKFHNKGVDKIKRLVGKLNNFQQKVLLVRDFPSYYRNPIACYLKQSSFLLYRGCSFDISKGTPLDYIENLKSAEWSVVIDEKGSVGYQVIDTHQLLCSDMLCNTIINGEFIMRDKNHLNERLSKKTNEQLFSLLFKQSLEQP